MAYELIETIELASAASSIEFTSIPQDGVDLVVLYSGRATTNNLNRTLGVRVNSNTSDIYSTLRLQGTGSSVGTNSLPAGSGVNFINLDSANGGTQTTANTFSNVAIYFSNYANTTANKSVSADAVFENNATAAYQNIYAAQVGSTAAITTVNLLDSGGSFAIGTTASLYKITAD